ncbi:5'-methylthioadenosine/S-adenosylhomocysteine nucleosidase family protein [Aspergillus lucknowensis]|uniref:Nucleoside phosphorylase domain-containing protein n=1 Tax=Aspergillus lucknowensis TaxID=176173 RepID=A0ABR4LT29_9EURO
MMGPRRFQPEDYTVGWVTALPVELAAASEMLDEEHPELPHDPNDNSIYTLGRVGRHNVVIACLPAGQFGTTSATTVAVRMKVKFPAVRFGLMVGVGGGVPGSADIRLGDVVVSQPSAEHGGVVQYDSGTATASGFRRKGFLNAPPPILLNALSKLRANHLRHRSQLSEHLSAFGHLPRFQCANAGADKLFLSTYNHTGGPTCEACDERHLVVRTPRESQNIEIHYGTIASGNQVIRDSITRDQLSAELGNVLCFEMEAAGLMNSFPCIVIRGICDYADTHKNKRWQPYAAATAAAYAKDLLSVIPATDVTEAPTMQSTMRPSHHGQSVHVANRSLDAHKTQGRYGVSNTTDIIKLSQAAYSLFSTLRGSGEAPSTVIELADGLFGLYCSLSHLSQYIRQGLSSAGTTKLQTSNIFKRSDVLILRCGFILDEIQRSLDERELPGALASDTTAYLKGVIAQLQAEVEWCLSSIDIFLDGLLRQNPSSPTKTDVDNSSSIQRVDGASEVRRTDMISMAYGSARNTAVSRNQIVLPSMPSVSPGSMEVHAFSHSTSPRVWIRTLQSQLDAWESTAVKSSREKRARQNYALNALISLNSHIASIGDIYSRHRVRKELEHHGLTDVIEKMKAVVGNLVMLEKQLEVYLDDKADDSVVS